MYRQIKPLLLRLEYTCTCPVQFQWIFFSKRPMHQLRLTLYMLLIRHEHNYLWKLSTGLTIMRSNKYRTYWILRARVSKALTALNQDRHLILLKLYNKNIISAENLWPIPPLLPNIWEGGFSSEKGVENGNEYAPRISGASIKRNVFYPTCFIHGGH